MTASRGRSGALSSWRRRRDLPKRRFWTTGLLFAFTLAALLYSVYSAGATTKLTAGTPSPQTYYAPQRLEVTDEVATARERQAARSQVPTLYRSVPALQELVAEEIAEEVATGLLPERVARFILATYARPQGVSQGELPTLISEAAALVPAAQRETLQALLTERLLASAEPNDELTEAARAAAAESVGPIRRALSAGETIVAEGEPLSENTLSVLEGANLYNPTAERLEQGVTLAVTCILFALFLSLPLLGFYSSLRRSVTVGQLSFLVILWAGGLVAQRLALLADNAFLFIAFLPLLGALLFSERVAFALAVWLSVITALLVPGASFATLFTVLAGSTATILLADTFHTRAAQLIVGLLGSVAGALGFTAYTVLSGGFGTPEMLGAVAWILGGGLLAGILAVAALPLAESNMGFLTEFRLLELMSPSNPLLQKLLLEAPGTYQHSLIISNLVDQAVSAIGGDALTARVGALYHDVGKLRRPQFFTENQFAGENPHDRTSPHLSYLIITSHVRDGVELLREYGLPAALEPFVNEHHGTTVLSYFYKRALEGDGNVREFNFRYAGPRPQSKETAVLMLADAVESASRTLTEPSQGSIRAMIDRLIEQRLQDDQLAESPLNFRDLEVIANTFERMLTAILHRRVTYPSAEEIQRLKDDRNSRRGAALPLS